MVVTLFLLIVISSEKETLSNAEELLNNGKVKEAVELLEPLKFSKDKKIRERALVFLSKGYFELNDWEKVEETSQIFERDFPKSHFKIDVYYLRAKSFVERGDSLQALYYFLEVYKGDERFKEKTILRITSILNLDKKRVEYLLDSGILSCRVKPTRRVDLLLPRNGPLAPIGEEFLKGFRLGLKGPIEARVWDSGGAPEIAREKLEKISRENTALLIGPLTTREIEMVENLIGESLLPLFSPTAYKFDSFLKNPFYFTVFGNLALETRQLALKFIDEKGYTKVAILYPEEAWGIAVASYFENLVREIGGNVVFYSSFSPDSLDFSDIIERIKEISPDVVFLPGGGPGAFILAYQMRIEEIEIPILGLEEWAEREGRTWGERGIDNVWVAHIPQSLKSELEVEQKRQRFLREYKRIYEREPTTFAERGYDCGRLVSILLKEEPLPALKVKKKLEEMKIFNGISGNFLLDDAPGLIKISVYKKGRLVEGGE